MPHEKTVSALERRVWENRGLSMQGQGMEWRSMGCLAG